MPWIGLEDLLGVLLTSIADERLEGPVNAVSPERTTNADFTRAMGQVLGRPTILPVPRRP
jgi:NAD dependent epimerase/dehydratase family enzyme